MHHDRRLLVQVHHTIGKLQAHVDAVQQWQTELSHMQQVVQGATRHVLSNKTKMGNLQAGTNEAHEALVPKMPERLDFPREVLDDDLWEHRVVPVKLLNRDLLPSVIAPENLAELARTKVLNELQLGVAYFFFRSELATCSV